jgi:AraC family transcriptional regulator of adaptative response / DNA-3-methyladenine glycosylase II
MIVQRIDEGMLDGGAGLERIADQFGWSSRQIRRILQQELGVSPIELLQTRRLLLAKQLLTETTLSVTEVAFASGFASLRRFNDAFSRRYGMPPTRLRKATNGTAAPASAASITLQLGYRPPFDWAGLLDFLGARALRGVERIEGDTYLRTIRLGAHTGWVRVRHAPKQRALLVEFPHSLVPVLPALLGRLRNLFDLSARPDLISAQLGPDALLAKAVKQRPGLRVPGAFDGFELAVRAVLGQQVTVKAATTVAARLVDAFGEPVATPLEGLTHLTPSAARITSASLDDVTSLGIVRTRAECIMGLARAVESGALVLEPGASPEATMQQLMALPGIGAWTAHYLAMRALRWPDAFPKEDLIVRRRMGGVTPARAEAMSEAWRPWRSYAVLHLWRAES